MQRRGHNVGFNLMRPLRLFYVGVENLRSSDLTLTLGNPLYLVSSPKYRLMNAIVRMKALSHSLAFHTDTYNRRSEKNLGSDPDPPFQY
jgi:hypothetical protein